MQIEPDFPAFQLAAQGGASILPLREEVLADLETPVSLYAKAKRRRPGPSFLLESVEGGEKLGRYSLIGVNPAALLTVRAGETSLQALWPELASCSEKILLADPFEALKKYLQLLSVPSNSPYTGFYGALAYDSIRFIEHIPRLRVDEEFPEAAFMLSGDLIVFDHLKKTLQLLTHCFAREGDNLSAVYEGGLQRLRVLREVLMEEEVGLHRIVPLQGLNAAESLHEWQCNFTPQGFKEAIEEAKERICAGDIFQVVPSQQWKLHTHKRIAHLNIYRLLRSLNPSPYLFLFDLLDFQLIGSSPEVMVKNDAYESTARRRGVLRPIAGTYRRGGTPQEDEALARSLKRDPKEVAEHLMLVDLARNDLGRVAIPGSVEPSELMIVEKYSHVLHLVSEVICELDTRISPVQLLRAVFPAGTLSGAPKVKAMRIIAELEDTPRGFYAGCVGFLGFDGSSNLAMTIRTVLAKPERRGCSFRLQAGGGIVYDSEPATEYQETVNKAAALLKVLERALQDDSSLV